MDKIQVWMDEKLIEIANKLKGYVHDNPASFACGYNVGYKQAILDIQNFIVHQVGDLD